MLVPNTAVALVDDPCQIVPAAARVGVGSRLVLRLLPGVVGRPVPRVQWLLLRGRGRLWPGPPDALAPSACYEAPAEATTAVVQALRVAPSAPRLGLVHEWRATIEVQAAAQCSPRLSGALQVQVLFAPRLDPLDAGLDNPGNGPLGCGVTAHAVIPKLPGAATYRVQLTKTRADIDRGLRFPRRLQGGAAGGAGWIDGGGVWRVGLASTHAFVDTGATWPDQAVLQMQQRFADLGVAITARLGKKSE